MKLFPAAAAGRLQPTLVVARSGTGHTLRSLRGGGGVSGIMGLRALCTAPGKGPELTELQRRAVEKEQRDKLHNTVGAFSYFHVFRCENGEKFGSSSM
jgi:hypothetical protein